MQTQKLLRHTHITQNYLSACLAPPWHCALVQYHKALLVESLFQAQHQKWRMIPNVITRWDVIILSPSLTSPSRPTMSDNTWSKFLVQPIRCWRWHIIIQWSSTDNRNSQTQSMYRDDKSSGTNCITKLAISRQFPWHHQLLIFATLPTCLERHSRAAGLCRHS